MPLPRVLTMVTVPRCCASTSPTTPSLESARRSSGSTYSASTRRNTTSTRFSVPSDAHPQLAVAHHQIRALHQRETQQRREIRLIESGLGVDAGAEHDHHRVLDDVGCGVDQCQPQRLRERCRRPWRDPLVEIGNRVREHAPVGQRIAGPRGGLRPVAVDLKAAIREPAEVTGVHEKLVVSGDLNPVGGPHIPGMGEQQFRRKDALDQQAARPVQVGEHGIEHARSLHQPGLQQLPVGRGDDDRQGVQDPGTGLHAVAGKTINVGIFSAGVNPGVGDAVVVDKVVHHRAQPIQPHPAAVGDGVGQLAPGRPYPALCVDELVVADSRAVTQIEQCFLRPCGSVPGQQPIDVVAVAGEVTGNRKRHHCSTVRTRRRSRMPGAPMSVDIRACFSRISDRSSLPGVKPMASKRRARRDSAATALTGGSS